MCAKSVKGFIYLRTYSGSNCNTYTNYTNSRLPYILNLF